MLSINQDQEYPIFDAKSSDFASKYDVWVRTPTSVQERKSQFLKLINLSSDDDEDEGESDNTNAVLRNEEEMSLTTTSFVSDSSRILLPLPLPLPKESFISNYCKEQETGNSPLIQKLVERQMKVAGTMARTMSRLKSQWLSRLRSMTCVDHSQDRFDGFKDPHRTRVQRVKVRQNKKPLKELSAVFIGQDIQAHQGSILTMKFSQDGHYLATAGEDGVVRIWQVVEDDRSNDIDIPDVDPSCLYFTVNHHSELVPLLAEEQKLGMVKSLRKTPDSACVIVPSKVFRILEKPVHEFHGHDGEVLDLSWSSDDLLLSSSVDETVRLWRVRSDQCLKVFPHSNYVTCVQFNPVDDSYFISGSIDGKVRIWSISSAQVVDWTDILEIVTAVTYSPDGKGGIIGSMTGRCRFFSLSDYHFQLEASVCLSSKKKSPCKRIIGFQFCPKDASKVMVTCSDSYVRILHGINVIAKYKGQGTQLCASFTSDGKHVVSACEDSNIYVWKCSNEKEGLVYEEKTVRSSECFSSDASVVAPWSGLKVGASGGWNLRSSYLSVGQEKGSGTWPEEKLPSCRQPLCKSEYKFLKSCWQNWDSWGLVIVAAGWDGHIRSFLNYGLPVAL